MKRILPIFIAAFLFVVLQASADGLPEEENPLSVYPNPAVDRINVKLNTDKQENPEIMILDLTGKTVLKFDGVSVMKDHAVKAELDIDELKPGIYFVKVIQGDRSYSEKLIVK
ncbi:MAG: T9SS type A sorting domain-containing protein [Bacteroidales bacterium]|nr:T9SS type A sorting domain-containing protein [Bacteroidales bacterium]